MVNKIKEEIKNNKVLRIVLISFLAIIVGIGISYAFYAAIINGNETSTTLKLDAGTLSINYDGGDTIIAKGFLPGDEPFATKTFTLIGNNDSDMYMPYTVSLIVDANTFDSKSLRYSFSGENTSNNGKIIEEYSNLIGDGLEFGPGYFAPGATNAIHTYTFKFYFPDDGTDQSDEMNRVFEAHIKIEGAKITPEIPDDNENLYADGTIAGAIVGGPEKAYVRAEPTTTPGVDSATTDEGLIQGEDDFGSTYYFRGTVENNYLIFAGSCWRIVRVMGDGNVKITLDNYGTACSDDSTSTGAFYGDTISYFNGSNRKPAFNSTLAYETLLNFYEEISDDEKGMIVDSIWCQDYTMSSSSSSFYISDERLSNGNPSFMCSDSSGSDINEYRNSDQDGDLERGNKSLPVSIGLLTSDEVLFAGSNQNGGTKALFLNNKAYGALWATMSPGADDGAFHIEYVQEMGGAIDTVLYAASETMYRIRPTLVIDGTLQYSGTGGMEDPYSVYY